RPTRPRNAPRPFVPPRRRSPTMPKKKPAPTGRGADSPAPEQPAPSPPKKGKKKRANGQDAVDPAVLTQRALRQNDQPLYAEPLSAEEAAARPKGKTGRRVVPPAGLKQRDPSEDRILGYVPYEKQRQFHAAGARHRERLFMAGNQLGKTTAGACEVAFHATGLYPDWW